MAFSIYNVKPLHLYILFVVLILTARICEGTIQPLYYLFALLGWVVFFIAVKNFFNQKKQLEIKKKTPVKKIKK